MKTVQLSGIKIDDVGSLWHDLLKKEFDVEAVGSNADGTFVYVADDEEKDPQPIAESWVGKVPSELSRSGVEKLRNEITELVEEARKRRSERAQAKAAEEAQKAELIKTDELAASSNTADIGSKPVSFEDGEGNVIGELMEGSPDGTSKESWVKRVWKKLWV